MTKRIVLILVVTALLTIMWILRLPRVHYGISEGFYHMVTDEEKPMTYIYFDMGNQPTRFTLGVANISFSYYGEVVLDGRVNAVAENGGTWVFEIIDNDTIKFCQEESSNVVAAEFPMIPDGAIFKYADRK